MYREKRRLKEPEWVVWIPYHLKPKMQHLEETLASKLKEAEDRGSRGDIAGSQDAMRSTESIKREIEQMNKDHSKQFPGEGVCEACGVKFINGKEGDVHGSKPSHVTTE